MTVKTTMMTTSLHQPSTDVRISTVVTMGGPPSVRLAAHARYVAGSVVRMKLHNFMTYDFVEFHPGPHLNMILGPNGTGKSSIAAAIAIGLAFPPKIMGRAHDLKSYVKQGSEVAEIEIELKGRRGKRNSIVHRTFSRADDKSTFTLNGRNCTRRDILKLVKDYGVQANNLWYVPLLKPFTLTIKAPSCLKTRSPTSQR